MSEPKRTFRWELKDSQRAFWNVSAEEGITEEGEEGYFSTMWMVTVQDEYSSVRMQEVVRTQYDEPICLENVVQTLRETFQRFTDAALLERGGELERSIRGAER